MAKRAQGLRYKDNDQLTLVYLDGKRVGKILTYVSRGFAYTPNGSNLRGDFFPTMR